MTYDLLETSIEPFFIMLAVKLGIFAYILIPNAIDVFKGFKKGPEPKFSGWTSSLELKMERDWRKSNITSLMWGLFVFAFWIYSCFHPGDAAGYDPGPPPSMPNPPTIVY